MKILNDLKDIDCNDYILKLGSNWCVPCKMVDAILDNDNINKLSNDKNINIYKIDVDDDQFENLIDIYEVSSIPVLLYFKNKEFKYKSVGIHTEQQIINDISRVF